MGEGLQNIDDWDYIQSFQELGGGEVIRVSVVPLDQMIRRIGIRATLAATAADSFNEMLFPK